MDDYEKLMDAQQRIAELEGENERLKGQLRKRAAALHYTREHKRGFNQCEAGECCEARAALAPEEKTT